ncbi:MAG: peptide-N4-asparagine amidase, partial [Thermoplasmata archaeon]
MAPHYLLSSSSSPTPSVRSVPALPPALGGFANSTWPGPSMMLAPHPASGQPVSAVRATPAPWVPDTIPTVVKLGTDLKNTGFNQVVSLPNGSWERILLNYTGQVVSSVYDSSYEMWADSVPILFGTTPEYGTWTVLQDVTEYSVLLKGSAHLDFRLGDAVIGNGYFLTNLSLSFYPAPPRMPLPVVPSSFVPLFAGSNLVPSQPSTFTLATVPSNATNATLEVYEYGFGPNGQDEFWYQDFATGSSYREFTISSDGTPIAADYPFPFINTGGIDLFLWRPVTSVATLDNRPQRFDVTSSLPLLEGSHNFTVNFTGISPGSNWFIDADLALYTAPNVTGAVQVYHNDSITAAPPISVGSLLEERAQANFSSEAQILYSNGTTVDARGRLSEMFSANITRTHLSGGLVSWTNISQESRSSGSTRLSGPKGVEYLNRSFSAPFAVDLGSQQVLSSNNYPLFANVTTSLLNAVQIWNETFSQSASGGSPAIQANLVDQMVGANGSWVGEYYVPSSTSSQLVNFLNITSINEREFVSTIVFGDVNLTYSHSLRSTDTGATSATALPTVTSSTIDSPLALVGGSSQSVSDVGAPVVLYLEPWGGRAPFTYEWTELPLGCASSDTAYLTCVPTTPGQYPIQALVLDNWGDSATANIGSLLVVPDPVAVLFPSSPGVDLGVALSINTTIRNGIAPYTCAWFVDGLLAAPPGSCSATYQTL